MPVAGSPQTEPQPQFSGSLLSLLLLFCHKTFTEVKAWDSALIP